MAFEKIKIHPVFSRLHPKTHWRELLAMLMILLAVVFFQSERKEFSRIIPQLQQVNFYWLTVLFSLSALMIIFQAAMYTTSFAAIGLVLKLFHGIELFLKRNFLGVFLPAGGVSALAYSPTRLRREGYNKLQVHQASGLFGFAGLLSLVLVAIPVILYTLLLNNRFQSSWLGLLLLATIVFALYMIVRSIKTKGKFYRWLTNRFPSIIPSLNELFSADVQPLKYSGTIAASIGVELCGILTIYIAMSALGQSASLSAAATAYIVSVLMAVISPFMRGLGAVELTMVYVLQQFGYSNVTALSITLLYRIFEFWVPLAAGLFSFLWKGRSLFLRAFPVLITFTLGVVNIVSAVTPSLRWRSHLLAEYLPLTAIHASHFLVWFSGLTLLVTSVFLFRGLRSAWTISLLVACLSAIGHLTKALDYEEAILASITAIILAVTASEYRIRTSNKWLKGGIKTALTAFACVLIFGFISFYFIDKRHFNEDFTWQQSLLHTLKSFLLVEDSTLHPVTVFGMEFIWLLRIVGFLVWGFLLFCFIRPARHINNSSSSSREKAVLLVNQYGNTSIDYFKTYKDKTFFISGELDAFVSFRASNGFAIVLGEPVCDEEDKVATIKEFESFCRRQGLKPVFYRVDEDSIPTFNRLNKSKMMIGQEAIVDVAAFTLEGKDKKSLRNGINSLHKKGFSLTIHKAPQEEAFLKRLKVVSDDWLNSFDVDETVFSQGMFDEHELQQQDIIAVTDEAGNIKSFLNIIPDYAEDDCTYDLIRKTADAPGASMDALIIKLIEYAKENKKRYINLGLAPMTGITKPENPAEQFLKLVSRTKWFRHYESLREFKEKYATIWENKYLVFDNDFDLLQLPAALNNVMKP